MTDKNKNETDKAIDKLELPFNRRADDRFIYRGGEKVDPNKVLHRGIIPSFPPNHSGRIYKSSWPVPEEPIFGPQSSSFPPSMSEEEYNKIIKTFEDIRRDNAAADVKKEKQVASGFLDEAAEIMKQRAALRDKPDGERTANQIAKVFNAITGHTLTEADAWMFLIVMKIIRSRSGKYNRDDYVDLSAYSALLGEHESEKERN